MGSISISVWPVDSVGTKSLSLNLSCRAVGGVYDFPGDQEERGRLDVMRWPYSEALGLYLERARDSERGLESAWCADYWPGGPWAGGGRRGIKKGK